jgi:hypothetical protein
MSESNIFTELLKRKTHILIIIAISVLCSFFINKFFIKSKVKYNYKIQFENFYIITPNLINKLFEDIFQKYNISEQERDLKGNPFNYYYNFNLSFKINKNQIISLVENKKENLLKNFDNFKNQYKNFSEKENIKTISFDEFKFEIQNLKYNIKETIHTKDKGMFFHLDFIIVLGLFAYFSIIFSLNYLNAEQYKK